jgi:hypothetical protein
MRRVDLPPAKPPKLKRYQHQLEAGMVGWGGVTREALEQIAIAVRARVEDVTAWRGRAFGGPNWPIFAPKPRGRLPLTFRRPWSGESIDEVDRLFRSAR